MRLLYNGSARRIVVNGSSLYVPRVPILTGRDARHSFLGHMNLMREYPCCSPAAWVCAEQARFRVGKCLIYGGDNLSSFTAADVYTFLLAAIAKIEGNALPMSWQLRPQGKSSLFLAQPGKAENKRLPDAAG